MMKQRMYGMSLLVASLAVLALSGPAQAGTQVPFKGQSSGVVETVGFSYPFGTASVAGEGEATHLGHFTVSAVVFVDVRLPGGTVAGFWTLTAANGDELFGPFVGYGIDPTHGGGEFLITGGTGRFQGATGHYTQVITFAAPGGSSSNRYTDVLEGTISSPGSNH